jgi:hypothetical protein
MNNNGYRKGKAMKKALLVIGLLGALVGGAVWADVLALSQHSFTRSETAAASAHPFPVRHIPMPSWWPH